MIYVKQAVPSVYDDTAWQTLHDWPRMNGQDVPTPHEHHLDAGRAFDGYTKLCSCS